jgi:hypothetical protein
VIDRRRVLRVGLNSHVAEMLAQALAETGGALLGSVFGVLHCCLLELGLSQSRFSRQVASLLPDISCCPPPHSVTACPPPHTHTQP